jgi:beta-1,4-mannosyltransferase
VLGAGVLGEGALGEGALGEGALGEGALGEGALGEGVPACAFARGADAHSTAYRREPMAQACRITEAFFGSSLSGH